MDLGAQNRSTFIDRVKHAALAGGTTGGIVGLVTHVRSGAGLSALQAMKNVGASTLSGSALGASGIALGDILMGEPEPGEKNPYTRRGWLGGGLAGGVAGGVAGGLAGSGTLAAVSKLASKIPSAGKWAARAGTALEERLPESIRNIKNMLSQTPDPAKVRDPNVLKNYIKGLGDNPSIANALKGSLIGAATAGALGANQVGDEGMGLDVISNELDAHQARRIRRRY